MPTTFNNIPSQYTPIASGSIPSAVPLSSQGQSNISGSVSRIGSSISGSFSNSLSLAKSQVSGSLNKFKSQLDVIKGKQSELDPYKNINDPKSFLKQQRLSVSRNQVLTTIAPIISKFVKTEFIARLLIKKLEKQTREQVKNKGVLTISGGVFTFTPSKPGDYAIYKSNFDRKVTRLKTTIQNLQQIVTLLNNIIRIVNISLSIIQLYIKIKLSLLTVKSTVVTADLATPSPSKSSGRVLSTIQRDILTLQKWDKKIDNFRKGIAIAQSFLIIFRRILTDIKIKLDQLQFIIIGLPGNNTDSISQLQEVKTTAPDNESYTDAFGKSYILKLVTLPNGAIQYQALDGYSKLKITQTAPSKRKTPNELLDEIKQILG